MFLVELGRIELRQLLAKDGALVFNAIDLLAKSCLSSNSLSRWSIFEARRIKPF